MAILQHGEGQLFFIFPCRGYNSLPKTLNNPIKKPFSIRNNNKHDLHKLKIDVKGDLNVSTFTQDNTIIINPITPK